MIKHVTETNFPDTLSVEKISVVYTQCQDNYSPNNEDQKLTIETEPGGYYVISTERWAIDDFDEVQKVFDDFKAKVEFIEDDSQKCKVKFS